jgi:membrane protease YdiL (CAAX protease family)
MKKIFIDMSSWSQLFFLWLFWGLGFVVSSLLVAFLAFFFIEGNNMSDMMDVLTESSDFLRISQLMQQLFLFFVPACLCAYLFNRNTANYLKIDKLPNIEMLFTSVALIIFIQPLISCTGYYNSQIDLPEFMSGIESWMKITESRAEILTERLLGGETTEALMLNLFIVAFAAAVVEEFFFRGVLQQIFHRITNSGHWAVWITAIIFSAIHMQFYGFVPRFLLGVLLGYLFVYSGSLWTPVIIHFINNAAGVLLFYFYHGTPEYKIIENMGYGDMQWMALISLLLTAVTLYYITLRFKQNYKTYF